MKAKNSIFELEEQEALELLESIKKACDQDKKLLTDNAFIYFCFWLSFNKPHASDELTRRVKVFSFPDLSNPC